MKGTGSGRILLTDAQELAGLGAIRSLGRAGYHVVAASPVRGGRPSSSWSRYCAEVIRQPDPWESQPAYQDWLRAQARMGSYDMVLPISEAAVFGAAAIRDDLSGKVVVLAPPDAALTFTLSKYHATEKAIACGVLCPPTVFVTDGGGRQGRWEDALRALRTPVTIKTSNVKRADGSYARGRAVIAESAGDAVHHLRGFLEQGGAVIAQEIIPGSGVGVCYLRFGGDIHAVFAHRRLHEVPFWGGRSSLRESWYDEELVRQGAALLQAIDYEGVAMVEFRQSSIDGRSYFLEINGRLWGSLALALHCGVDFPRLLAECYRDGRPGRGRAPYPLRVKCRNVFMGEIGYLSSVFKARGSSWGVAPPGRIATLLRFLLLFANPTIRYDHLWLTDPLPGIVQVARETARGVTTLVRRVIRAIERRRKERVVKKLRAAYEHREWQPLVSRKPASILFVCYGNVCRSAFAEYYWNTRAMGHGLHDVHARSCGFHPRTSRRTPARIAAIAAEHGIDLTPHVSRAITAGEVASADAIFVMDASNFDDLVSRFPEARDRTYFLGWFAGDLENEIDDPYRMDDAGVRRCFMQMRRSLEGLFRCAAASATPGWFKRDSAASLS